MSKISDFWKDHTDTEGRIIWPADQDKRNSLARTLFGLCFVESLDYWLARADGLIENPNQPEEPWKRASEDPAMRTTFAAMSEEQREATRKLLRETVQGALFSSLVHVDQHPQEHFEVRLVSAGQEGVAHPAANDDLHDDLYEWVWEFSQYRDVLMLKQSRGRVESVRWKASGRRLGE